MTDATLTHEVTGTDSANPSGLAVAKPAGTLTLLTARYLADNCLIAYWMTIEGRDGDYFLGRARDDLRILADLFGYRLEAK